MHIQENRSHSLLRLPNPLLGFAIDEAKAAALCLDGRTLANTGSPALYERSMALDESTIIALAAQRQGTVLYLSQPNLREPRSLLAKTHELIRFQRSEPFTRTCISISSAHDDRKVVFTLVHAHGSEYPAILRDVVQTPEQFRLSLHYLLTLNDQDKSPAATVGRALGKCLLGERVELFTDSTVRQVLDTILGAKKLSLSRAA